MGYTSPLTQAELNRITKKHKLWLLGDPNGCKADFSDMFIDTDLVFEENLDLSGVSFRNALIYKADFSRYGLVLNGAIFSGASGRELNFEGLSVNSAVFDDSYFLETNFKKTSLVKTDFTGADLTDSQFQEATLTGALFSGAKLWDVSGNEKEIVSFQLDDYYIVCASGVLQIGCKSYPPEEWWGFTDEVISKMDTPSPLGWWKSNKEKLQQLVASGSINV